MSTAPTPRVRLLLALAAVYVIWSSTYLALRIVVAGQPAFLISGVRYVVAGLLLLGFVLVRGGSIPNRREWLAALPIGALLFVFGNGLVAYTSKDIPSGLAAVVCALTPLFAAFIRTAFGEKVRGVEWASLPLGVLGVALLATSSERSGPLSSYLLLGLAPAGWALGSVLAGRLKLAAGAAGAASQMVTGGLSMMAIGLVRGEPMPSAFDGKHLAAFAYLVVFGSMVAFTAFGYLLRNTSTSLALSYSYVNPVLAMMLGSAFGGESFGPRTLGASSLVVASVAVIVLPWDRRLRRRAARVETEPAA